MLGARLLYSCGLICLCSTVFDYGLKLITVGDKLILACGLMVRPPAVSCNGSMLLLCNYCRATVDSVLSRSRDYPRLSYGSFEKNGN